MFYLFLYLFKLKNNIIMKSSTHLFYTIMGLLIIMVSISLASAGAIVLPFFFFLLGTLLSLRSLIGIYKNINH